MERLSSSNTGHIARLATKGSVRQSPVDRPVQSEHVPVTPGPSKPGTSVPGPGARSHRPHRVKRVHPPHRPHRVHQSHRVHRSHWVHRSDQSTLVRKLKRKRPTSAWTCLSFLFLIHRQLEHNVHEPQGNMPILQIEHSSEHSQAFQDLTNSDSPVPGNIGCTGYTGSDQAQPVTPGALVTPGDPSLSMLLQIDPLGLGIGFRLRPLT